MLGKQGGLWFETRQCAHPKKIMMASWECSVDNLERFTLKAAKLPELFKFGRHNFFAWGPDAISGNPYVDACKIGKTTRIPTTKGEDCT